MVHSGIAAARLATIDPECDGGHISQRSLSGRLANKERMRSMAMRESFSNQAKMFKALAHESRLIIVDRLSRGECSVGDLRELVGSDLSTVSKHLALLRAHGIVEDRREGTIVYYRLLTPSVRNFFACATKVLKERSRSAMER